MTVHRSALRQGLIATVVALAAACTTKPSDPVAPLPDIAAGQQQSAVAAVAPPATKSYSIEPANSNLQILVYRGGPMARLGHNHVVRATTLHGSIWRGPSGHSAGFDISVPVNDLEVDNDADRSALGPDFPLNLSADAKRSTKVNMLREPLLDGAHYPEVKLRSVSVQDDKDTAVVVAAVRIKGRTRHVTVPVTLLQTDQLLRVQGGFEIKQTDFGLTPLSIAMGALLVQDTVHLRFSLVATLDSSPNPNQNPQ